jgi:putative ABC transport system substrate-binding protein
LNATLARRRDFLLAAMAVMAYPEARAAPPGQRRVVWILEPGTPVHFEERKFGGFSRVRDWFASRGFAHGQNLDLVVNVMPSAKQDAEAYVNQVVASQPDAIMMIAMSEVWLLQNATRRIPIVFYNLGNDPTRVGWVESLRRPGANITGTTLGHEEVQKRAMQALKVIAPSMKRLGLLTQKEAKARMEEMIAQSPFLTKAYEAHNDALKQAASQLGIEVREVVAPEKGPIHEFRAAVAQAGVDALMITDQWPHVMEYLKTAKMPTCGTHFEAAKQGMLLATGFDWNEGEQQAVAMVAAILRGANPATMPVYRNTRYLMAVNRTTARALGLTIPASILVQADKVFD